MKPNKILKRFIIALVATMLVLQIVSSLNLIPYVQATPLTLHADTRYIKDSNNDTVILKGLHLGIYNNATWDGNPDTEFISATGMNQSTSLQAMEDWNATTWRMFLNARLWTDNENGARVDIRDSIIEAGTHGLYVIVCPWRVNESIGGVASPFYNGYWTETDLMNFWISVCDELGDLPNFIPEVWNEPWDASEAEWASALQSVTDGIRNSTSYEGLILIEANKYGQNKAGGANDIDLWHGRNPITDTEDNLVVVTHCYGEYEGYAWNNMTDYDTMVTDLSAYRKIAENLNLPLTMTEGNGNASETEFLENILTIFDEWGIGYIGFTYTNNAVYGLRVGTGDPDPNARGIIFQNHFNALDTTAPVFWDIITSNTTVAGNTVILNATVSDNYGVSHFRFEWNNTGIPENQTLTAFSSNPCQIIGNWNNTIDAVVTVKVYANDTSNLWSVSDQYNFTLTASDSYYFGKTDIGYFSDSPAGWYKNTGCYATANANGNITTITFYGKASIAGENFTAAVYQNISDATWGSTPNSSLGISDTYEDFPTTEDWYEFDFSTEITVTVGTTYWLSITRGGTGMTYYYDDGATNQTQVSTDSPPPNDPWAGTTEALNREISLYATLKVDDTSPPTYSSLSHSTTTGGDSCNFSLTVNDDVGLQNNGQIQFGTNNTGTWEWDSLVNFTMTPQSYSIFKDLNETEGQVVGYMFNFTDNVGNSNTTGIQTLTISTLYEDWGTWWGGWWVAPVIAAALIALLKKFKISNKYLQLAAIVVVEDLLLRIIPISIGFLLFRNSVVLIYVFPVIILLDALVHCLKNWEKLPFRLFLAFVYNSGWFILFFIGWTLIHFSVGCILGICFHYVLDLLILKTRK